MTRRELLIRSGRILGATVAFGAAGCSKRAPPLSCTDTTGLPLDAVALRTSPAVAYTDRATDPARTCERCQQFIPAPTERACGSCKVLKGPINPRGSCRLFAPKMGA